MHLSNHHTMNQKSGFCMIIWHLHQYTLVSVSVSLSVSVWCIRPWMVKHGQQRIIVNIRNNPPPTPPRKPSPAPLNSPPGATRHCCNWTSPGTRDRWPHTGCRDADYWIDQSQCGHVTHYERCDWWMWLLPAGCTTALYARRTLRARKGLQKDYLRDTDFPIQQVLHLEHSNRRRILSKMETKLY